MTTNQLKYFVTVAECLNFTEAGKKHFISQTAITQHIRALEEQLGTQLFIRDRRHVELTPAGRVFLEEAKGILEKMAIAKARIEKAANGFAGDMNVGYVRGYETSHFPFTLKKIHNEYPNIAIHLTKRSHLDLFYLLDQGHIDLAFNIKYKSTDLSGYETLTLYRSPLYVALYPSHPYARLSGIRRYDLRNENFLLTKFYDDRTARDYTIPDQFASSGFIPNVVDISSDLETLLLMVSSQMGITIVPEYVTRFFGSRQNLTFIPLVGEHEYVDITALWKKENNNPALATVVNFLKKEYNLE